MLTIAALLSLLDWVMQLNDQLYSAMNGLAGRSLIFDTLVVLPTLNNLVKGGLLGSCFIYAWLKTGDGDEAAVRRRRVLITTVIASVFVVATTKAISKSVFLPRPFMQSQKNFHLEGDQLVESRQLEWRVPLDEESQKNARELNSGVVYENDMGTFPSDHSGFFMTVAFGILLASRRAGLLAVTWTIIITLGSRVISGQHTPLDIVSGWAIGLVILVSCQYAAFRFGRALWEPVVYWTIRYTAFSTGLIFIYVFEVANTLEDLRPLAKLPKVFLNSVK